MRSGSTTVITTAAVLTVTLGAAPAPAWHPAPAQPAAASAGPAPAVTASPAVRVAKLTGPGSINRTDTRHQIKATDLGILWDNNAGQVLVAFGDTFGAGWTGPGGGVGDPATLDWRCNILARSTDRTLADGLTFDSVVEDVPGHAGELLPCRKIDHDEITVIPTAGVAVGARSYLHYMSVRHWGPPGQWQTNHAGIAYSDDNGRTWVKHPTARWLNNPSGSDGFQMGAFARAGGFVYLFATPNGRFGPARLARVPESGMLDPSAWRYWTGATWSPDRATATTLVPGPVGELSVHYSTDLGRWLMMYLDENRHGIVLRDAPAPTGPWSAAQTVATAGGFPGLYAPYIHPWSSGPDLYFTMSQWDPYNVYLMRTRLGGGNLVADPGFELQGGPGIGAPWRLGGTGGVDRGLGLAHSGGNNAWLRAAGGWHHVFQDVSVQPGRRYRLTGWLRTSGNATAGYFGVRTTTGRIVAERRYGPLPSYQRLTVDADVGTLTTLQVFAGLWATGVGTWVQIDDVTLTPLP
ncbi:DUF4185 domain-containing protein [Micromonospora sp. NPDC047707]|uniref:DUF4185 domain-containing protein n=1 Tax=Micromonospora sp. NPDC047707 TaxID=3154498 RepID=UPI003453A660